MVYCKTWTRIDGMRRRFMGGKKKLAYGVYIRDANNNYFKHTEWATGNHVNPMSIAVITSMKSFCVSFELLTLSWATGAAANTTIPGITTTIEESIAKADINGKTNTNRILAAQPTNAIAAIACRNHVFLNGEQGYLPALNELIIFGINIDEIGMCALAVKGTNPFKGNSYYWSSTQQDHLRAWICTPRSFALNYSLKINPFVVLPFGTI